MIISAFLSFRNVKQMNSFYASQQTNGGLHPPLPTTGLQSIFHRARIQTDNHSQCKSRVGKGTPVNIQFYHSQDMNCSQLGCPACL